MRDLVFSIRLTEKERQAINQAAQDCELGPSTWARFVLLAAIDVNIPKPSRPGWPLIAARRCPP
jgi:hypothetical protein